MKRLWTLCLVSLLLGCAGLPDTVQPVTGFDLSRYTGTWYEIARLDHRFERGLERVTATYAINPDGSVRVENRGFAVDSGTWSTAVGKAKPVGDGSAGRFKVSFFGPFYAPYVVFELDREGYQHAFVTGSADTLWLLARTPQVPDALKARFVAQAQQLGYDTDGLIWVRHD